MLPSVICAFVLSILAVACVPGPRIQVFCLKTLRLGLTLLALIVVVAAGWATARPEQVPAFVTQWAEPIASATGLDPRHQEFFWTILAVIVILPMSAVLAGLDLAIRLTAHADLVSRLLADLRGASRALKHAARRRGRSVTPADTAIARGIDAIDPALDALSRITRPTPASSEQPERRRVAEFLNRRP
jgi:multisubunit Na+/H+ antiporter MnhB subunit